MQAKGEQFTVRMCTAVVGNKDVKALTQTLHSHPFKQLELIPFSWKRKDLKAYTSKLQDHDKITRLSSAFRVEQLDQTEGLQNIKDVLQMHDDTSPYIVNIALAIHADTTGVTYVQYISTHRDVVLSAIQEYLHSQTASSKQFPSGPVLASGGASYAPTLQNGSVQSHTTTVIPPGRFDSILASTPSSSVYSPPSRQSIPRSINLQVKSFGDALHSSMSNLLPFNDDLSTDSTRITDNTGSKNQQERLSWNRKMLSSKQPLTISRKLTLKRSPI